MTATPSRIFAIDDEPDNLLLIRQALRQLGYPHCETESDPVRAVERFGAEDFDLVLLDYNMPKLSGMGVLNAIADKSRSEQIPVVMVTAQIDRDTRLQTLGAGAKDFLGKPIDIAELKVRVHNLLETRSLHLALRQHNQHLEEVVRERTEELRSTQLEVIQRLARAAEFRDTDTGLHIKRMSLYAQVIGREMGMSVAEHELLLNASPMHDLGKIGIPDQILLKPGKLTPEEFAIMQEHTQIGATILHGHDSELLRTAYDIALCHHERWDGTGYPRGLRGQEIPFHARIAAVADVFDALTMVRPYKPAWPTDAAYREVCRFAGHQFDPDVILAFDSCLEQILQIRHANPDPAR